jgi:hypothetical protein
LSKLLTGLLLLFLVLHAPRRTAAQQVRSHPFFPAAQAKPILITPGAAMLASAIIPGVGQKLLGNERWVPYIAVEAWAWVTYLNRRGEGSALKRRYRDLAWFVARRVSVGERRDTTFPYYEALTKHEASGAFDVDPRTDGIQPETDGSTFNGQVWDLARSLFFPSGIQQPVSSPQYQSALSYYQRNAIPPSYAWAWGDNELEQRVFGEVIHQSDEALRASSRTLGVILANHMASAVDALIASRLQMMHIDPSRLKIENSVEPLGRSLRWRAEVHLKLPGR